MVFVFGTFVDPLLDQGDFAFGELCMKIRWGHPVISVLGSDTLVHEAIFGTARNDRVLDRLFAQIESKIRLASLLIKTMAGVASF